MELALTAPLRRGLFLVGAVLLTALLTYSAGRVWRAEHHAGAENPEAWQRAAALEPGNGDHWYRLGWYHQNDFTSLDLDLAIENYQRAIERNPRSAAYWMDLAAALEALGRVEEARAAFDRARQAHPVSGDVAWRLGNFHLRQGELAAGFAEIRRAVELDPQLTRLGVSLCWRAGGEPAVILREALPPTLAARLVAMEFFRSQLETDAALAAWRAVYELGRGVEMRHAVGVVDLLISQNRLEEARRLWEEAAVISEAVEAEQPLPLVWDGGFAFDPLNGGFGWRISPLEGVRIDFDEAVYRSAPRSLRLRFDGTRNLGLGNIVQFVPVSPNRRYRFSGYIRSENVSTDSGVRFGITDAQHRGVFDILTHNVVGTQPWALEEVQFNTGPETRLVRIEIRRLPSRKLDNRIRGTVWIDDVSLEAIPAGRGMR